MKSKYNTENIEKCEYIDMMLKVYFKRPKRVNDKCLGFHNKYTKKPSHVCKNCKNYIGDNYEFDDGTK